jgi:MinD superfamily P-loop ATPase
VTGIAINHKKCDECGACISVCRKDALVLGEKLEVLADRCVSCGVCVNICPFAALATNGETA